MELRSWVFAVSIMTLPGNADIQRLVGRKIHRCGGITLEKDIGTGRIPRYRSRPLGTVVLGNAGDLKLDVRSHIGVRRRVGKVIKDFGYGRAGGIGVATVHARHIGDHRRKRELRIKILYERWV